MFLTSTKSMLTEEGAKRSRIFPKGTLLLVNSGATLGVPKITCIDACGNDGIAGFLDLSSEADISFLYYFLYTKTRYFRDCLAPGLGQPNLNTELIGGVSIPLPPLPEQKKIAEILSAWDRAIEQVGKLIDAKQRLKKGLMQQLLTGRMRFPEFNHETHERHEKDKGELPEGWKRVRLKDVCKVAYGKDWKTVACSERAYPVYGTGGVIGYASSPLYSGPSILLGRKGTIDNPVYINSPFWAVDTTFYTEIKKEMDPKFIFFLFCCIHWHRYNEASGVPSLSRNPLEKIKLALPSFDEQRCIAAVLSTCDWEIELLKKKQEKLKEQKKGLMQKLLTGEVRVKADGAVI